MYVGYLITPFIAWLITGVIKFTINSIRSGDFAFKQIGYGGMPSNHSSIVSSVTMLIALREGIAHPAFGVAITLSFIVILDAASLRRKIGEHAVAINKMVGEQGESGLLREKLGHSLSEIMAGIFTGALTAWAVNTVLCNLWVCG